VRRILLIALVVTVTAGCGGDVLLGRGFSDELATKPRLPDAATQRTANGAQALAGYYVEALNWALTTGDARTAAAITDPSCDECPGVVSVIRRVHAEVGDRFRLVLDSATLQHNQIYLGAEFGVELAYHVAVAGPLLRPSEALTPGSLRMSVWVHWRSGGWRIIALGLG
jgi:hypothetical protein